MPTGTVGTRHQSPLGFGDPSAAGEDDGEHGNGGDDGDTRAQEAIFGVAAEGQRNANRLSGDGRRDGDGDADQGRGGHGGGEDCSGRRLNGRSHGGQSHRDGDDDINVVRRLRSVGTATGKRVSWDTGVGEWKRCQAVT